MRPLPEILATETVARSRLFRVEKVDLRFANGVEVEYERVPSGGHGSVLIVPMLDADTCLLVREYAASDLNGDAPAYWYSAQSEEWGLDPWRLVEGVDPHVGGGSFDVCFASGGTRTVGPLMTFFLSAAHAAQLIDAKGEELALQRATLAAMQAMSKVATEGAGKVDEGTPNPFASTMWPWNFVPAAAEAAKAAAAPAESAEPAAKPAAKSKSAK